MKRVFLYLLFSLNIYFAKSQLYFPPNDSNEWDTLSTASLGWCNKQIDSLYEFLDINNSKAFILLKDGKIVLEKYFEDHDQSTRWYWASAAKSLTALAVGVAQQENYLAISDQTSDYLGTGWSNTSQNQEEQITIRHQLTMTSGLDDDVPDPNCTTDTCLEYLSDPGTRWAYHNAPYTLLDEVIESATGQTLNAYTRSKIIDPTGMDGLFIQEGFNNIFFSTARSMARFGLLILNRGNWKGSAILSDSNYFNAMTNTSQDLNNSYGYLWWLNGKEHFMIPQSQLVFPGGISPNAPNDMIAALGKNGQFINVVPSENIVWVRMGQMPGNLLVPFIFNDEIWKHLNALDCIPLSSTEQEHRSHLMFEACPLPVNNEIKLHTTHNFHTPIDYAIYNTSGTVFMMGTIDNSNSAIGVKELPPGLYLLKLNNHHDQQMLRIVKN